jgi:hypothetical protein
VGLKPHLLFSRATSGEQGFSKGKLPTVALFSVVGVGASQPHEPEPSDKARVQVFQRELGEAIKNDTKWPPHREKIVEATIEREWVRGSVGSRTKYIVGKDMCGSLFPCRVVLIVF